MTNTGTDSSLPNAQTDDPYVLMGRGLRMLLDKAETDAQRNAQLKKLELAQATIFCTTRANS